MKNFISLSKDSVNHSYHQGTGKVPILAYKKEKNLLSPLPNKRIRDFYKIDHHLVKVNTSNMITYKSNQYSVPAGYIGKTVGLQVYDNHIYVYYNTECITEHVISQLKINYRRDHYIETLTTSLPHTENIEEMAKKNLEAIDEAYKNE